MNLSANFVGLLRCPATGQPLDFADENLLAQLNSRRLVGKEALPGGQEPAMPETIMAALIRADGKLLYPIRNEIPVLLLEEAIPL